MEAYIILSICIIMVFVICPKKYINKYGLPICMIVFALFFGCRNVVAVDDKAYIDIFNAFSNNLINVTKRYKNIEISYKLLCGFFGILGFNFKAIFLFYSITSYTFLYLFLKKMELKKEELLIFLMTFFAIGFFVYMTVMRQFLAISISLYALTFLKEKKYKICVIYILIASAFHIFSLIMLIFIPIFNDEKIKVNVKIKIILPIIALLIGKLGIANSIINLVASISKYSIYTSENTNNAFGGSGILHYIWLTIYELQFLFKNYNKSTYYEMLERGQMIYLTIFFITINSGFALRISYLFLIFMCFIFITLLYRVKSKSNKYSIIYLVLISLLLFDIYTVNQQINSSRGNFGSNDFSINIFN